MKKDGDKANVRELDSKLVVVPLSERRTLHVDILLNRPGQVNSSPMFMAGVVITIDSYFDNRH